MWKILKISTHDMETRSEFVSAPEYFNSSNRLTEFERKCVRMCHVHFITHVALFGKYLFSVKIFYNVTTNNIQIFLFDTWSLSVDYSTVMWIIFRLTQSAWWTLQFRLEVTVKVWIHECDGEIVWYKFKIHAKKNEVKWVQDQIKY